MERTSRGLDLKINDMTHNEALDRLEGSSQAVTTFQELDSDYSIKIHAFFHLCLHPLTEALTSRFDFFGMARRGIAPITYFLDITGTGEPLALGRPVECQYTVGLFRAPRQPAPHAGGEPQQRLLLDQHVEVIGYQRSGSAKDLGFDDGRGALVKAGHFRLIQIFTRPMASPGNRQVTEVPEEFRALREHVFPEDFPSPDALWEAPEEYEALAPEISPAPCGIWGRGNTDINHHVTVTEYLRALENHFVRLLHSAKFNVPDHRATRVRCIFRRPFFAGDTFCVQGRLLRHGRNTRMHGGIYRCGENGEPEQQPSITACFEGVFQNDGEGSESRVSPK